MNEKAGIASSQDYGKDEDAATKALTKHKVCDLYTLCVRIYVYVYAYTCVFV